MFLSHAGHWFVIVAVLLAAGASERMGRPKLELQLAGETLIARSLQNLLDASVDRVRVVVPPGFDRELADDDRIELVTNPDWDTGIASSVRAGVANLPESTRIVLIALADQPLVRPETIRLLIDAFAQRSAPVVFPVFRGRQGHPVLWNPALVPELAVLEGDRGAKSVLERYRDDALAVEVDDPGACFDIDTPDDYSAARELVDDPGAV